MIALSVSVVFWATVATVVVVYCVFVFIRVYADLRRRAAIINQLPGSPRHWLWGNLHEFPGPGEDGLAYMRSFASDDKSKSGVRRFWFGPFLPHVALLNPNAVKTILRTSEPKSKAMTGAYYNLIPWLGDGLLLSNGEKWSRNRRLLSPAFHFEILKPYMEINNRCSDILINKLEKFEGEYFDVFTHISQLTLDIMLRCAFSYETDCQVIGNTHPYVNAVHSLTETVFYRVMRPWLYPKFIFNLTPTGRKFKRDCEYVHKVAEEVIQDRKNKLDKSGFSNEQRNDGCGRFPERRYLDPKRRYLDFVDVLLTAKDDFDQGLTDQEIRDEVDTFLFEGHDTTASGISWALYSLAANPEHQRKCQEEIDQVLKGKSNDDIEWDDLPNLKHVTNCIKESLRMNTVVPFIQRVTTKDLELEGYSIPAGTIVDIHLYMLHHNPRVWKDPEEYRPERFEAENMTNQDSFAFVPFSAGPRNCIGQHFAMHEMKSTVARILHR